MRFGFYDNRDNRNNGLILNSMLSVDNNKNNFYQPQGWLPLEPTFTFVALKLVINREAVESPSVYGRSYFGVSATLQLESREAVRTPTASTP